MMQNLERRHLNKSLSLDYDDLDTAKLIAYLKKNPGEGNDNPLQCSYLGNPMDRGAWRAIVHRVENVSDTT